MSLRVVPVTSSKVKKGWLTAREPGLFLRRAALWGSKYKETRPLVGLGLKIASRVVSVPVRSSFNFRVVERRYDEQASQATWLIGRTRGYLPWIGTGAFTVATALICAGGLFELGAQMFLWDEPGITNSFIYNTYRAVNNFQSSLYGFVGLNFNANYGWVATVGWLIPAHFMWITSVIQENAMLSSKSQL